MKKVKNLIIGAGISGLTYANYLYLIVYNNYNVKLNTEYSKNFDAINVANDFDNFVKNEVLNED